MAPSARTGILLAGYPRSGLNHLRFILAEVLRPGITASAQLLDVCPVDGSPHRFRWPVNFIKTHRTASWFPKDGSGFDAEVPLRGAVWLVRDPIQVMLSNLRFYFLNVGKLPNPAQRAPAIRDYLRTYLHQGGDPRWRRRGFGTWAEHGQSWLSGYLPVLRLRHEDLVQDPVDVACRVLEFGGVEVPRDGVERAAQTWTRERVRALEDEELETSRPGLFYRSGSEGVLQSGLRSVGRDLFQEMAERHGSELLQCFEPVASTLGYSHFPLRATNY